MWNLKSSKRRQKVKVTSDDYENSLDSKLVELLDTYVREENKEDSLKAILSNDYKVNFTSLYTTLTFLINYLSCEGRNSALHKSIIRYTSENISNYIYKCDPEWIAEGEDQHVALKCIAKEGELLMKNFYKVMCKAEEETINKVSEENWYIFKDGKMFIKDYFENKGERL